MEHDYHALGFKCGIEIHQQLSGRKLFCDCPAINSTKEPDIQIERRLRAVAGETGEIDVAAKHEVQKGKRFSYVGNSEDTCLVEFDEEPPHAINPEALATALEICELLHAKIVDEIQVMRKTVVDGSNTSGFQRTMLVGYDGYVDTSKGKVRIPNICLEEEAAQRLKETKDQVTYKLDRLGIALIEIGTEPDILDPLHAKETAEQLGMILRSTGKVKRGLGTIRQDVNISISGGARTEIKGFQDLKSMPKVIVFEVERQHKIIQQGHTITTEVRKAEPDFTTSFLRPMPGAARMYPETDVAPVRPVRVAVERKELLSERSERYLSLFKLGKDLATAIARSDRHVLFEEIARGSPHVKPAFIAETLISYPRELLRDHAPCDPLLIHDSDLKTLMTALEGGQIAKDSVMKILADVAKGKPFDIKNYALAPSIDLDKEIGLIAAAHPDANFSALMGEVMKRFRGTVDGKRVSELVRKYRKE
jgi:Glu-tRNA(Gln) amidotransferase subunit E-like FAD-binding protein